MWPTDASTTTSPLERVGVVEEALDRLRLGGRLDDDKGGGHCRKVESTSGVLSNHFVSRVRGATVGTASVGVRGFGRGGLPRRGRG